MTNKYLFWLLFIIVGLRSYFNSVGYSAVNYVFFNLVYLLYCVAIFKLSYFRIKDKFTILFYVCVILYSTSSFRFNLQIGNSLLSFISTIFFLSIIYIFVSSVFYYNSNIIKNLFTSILIYIFVNYIGRFLLGISNSEENMFITSLSSRVSIIGEKVYFPFTPNTRSFAMDCGVFGVFCFYYYKISTHARRKVLFLLLLIIAGITILLTDARFLFILLVLTVLLTNSDFKKLNITRTYIVVILCVLFPLLYLAIIFFGVAFVDIRNGIFTLNNRLFIWSISLYSWTELSMFHKLFGFGEWGQMTSGVNTMFSSIFSNAWADASTITTHNIIIQILYDQGIVGLLFYVLMIFFFINRLIKISHVLVTNELRLIIGILVYCVGAGITETFGFFKSPTMFIYFIFIIKSSEYYFRYSQLKLQPQMLS